MGNYISLNSLGPDLTAAKSTVWLSWCWGQLIYMRKRVWIVVVNVYHQAHFRKTTLNAPAQACVWANTVLPATHMLNPIGKDSSPVTTQYSPVVTHRILAATQFTYPKVLEGWVNPSAPGIEPKPYCIVSAVGGCSTNWASQTACWVVHVTENF